MLDPELNAMLDNLKSSNEADLHTRFAALESAFFAYMGKMMDPTENGVVPGVDDNGRARTITNGLALEQTASNAESQWANWWLPMALASDDITAIYCHLLVTFDSGMKFLYVGGVFTRIGGVDANNVARYNFATRQWEALSTDGTSANGVNGAVRALAFDEDSGYVYLGGDFTNAGDDAAADYICQHTGTSLSPETAFVAVNGVGSELNGIVRALAVIPAVPFGTVTLYVGGDFTNAGGDAAADYICKKAGTSWINYCGAAPGKVYSIALNSSEEVFICGAEALHGHIRKGEGGAWVAVNSSGDTVAYKVAFDANDVLHVGRSSLMIDSGGAWIEYAASGGVIYDIAFDEYNSIIVVGNFTAIDGVDAPRAALFDGATWQSLTNAGGLSGLGGAAYAVAVDPDNSTVYAGGDFDTAGTIQVNCIAAFCRPLSDAIDILAGLFEQYDARNDVKYVDKPVVEADITMADNTTNDASITKHGFLKKLSNVAAQFMNGVGSWVAIDHASNVSNVGTNSHSAIDTFIASKAAASGLASLDANSLLVQAIQRIVAGTSALTATEGYAEWQSTTKRLLLYDAQRERSLSSIGWTPSALPMIFDPSAALTTAYTLAANGGTIVVPILVTGHMLLQGVTVRNTDTGTARSWRWHLYEQYLNNGNAGENTLTRIESGNGNDSFTPGGAASNRTLNGTGAPTYLAPGLYWVAIQNVHATSTFGLASTAVGSSAFAPNSAQVKTLAVPLGSTLDLVAATWTKLVDIYAVRLNGRVFGQTTAF